ncbi:hypothetical protein BJV85_002398 [Clostridium acetobutylicum]|uniref:ISXO2-like transposase domain-containing protein n=1 Tax=Clostridium acetobutylicum (strain ATCC 824 / DSM 792 / JCM 1419 / IAM 19013 / LMG 5710 / NBRC 13948 / NRRL B-527 / VKM B-1787 / 2291 / W) TaxID=272562 RepID=Q97IP2_CLOAB|nr:Hypothetical protein, CF-32 family [Clostridium acetobutylicum ATCC 824]ADZ20650.1 conserved hypothetical protein [Clostridium acetobutylicum EA 2018]AEI31885.1 hypothetical protein SMB_G1623 [Clostridium acetobutylicum DSM 1731]AWV79995.1 IS1595 family transposase [Clostridium acetobutylicum]PSM07955.1 IS1595 family transposase [Clostridium sp. NJ4]
MPRKARKRGEKAKKRGISNEQVCVATAIDRAGNIIAELICKGRMSHKDLERLYKERIGDKSILCTDSHKSYIQFANDLSLEHQRIKRGHYKEGIYHIQHILLLKLKIIKQGNLFMYKFHSFYIFFVL